MIFQNDANRDTIRINITFILSNYSLKNENMTLTNQKCSKSIIYFVMKFFIYKIIHVILSPKLSKN